MNAHPGLRLRAAEPGTWMQAPAALAALLDFLQAAMLGQGGCVAQMRAERFQLDRLSAELRLGDLAAAASSIALAIIDDERRGNAALQAQPGLALLVDAVATLHKSVVDGAAPEPRLWASVRGAAIWITDTAQDPAIAATFTVMEAACWHPASARTVLVDTAVPWLTNRRVRAVRATGWTEADDARVHVLMRDMRAPSRGNGMAAAALQARDPTLARRYDRQRRVGQRTSETAIHDLARLCLDLMGREPASAPRFPAPARPCRPTSSRAAGRP